MLLAHSMQKLDDLWREILQATRERPDYGLVCMLQFRQAYKKLWTKHEVEAKMTLNLKPGHPMTDEGGKSANNSEAKTFS